MNDDSTDDSGGWIQSEGSFGDEFTANDRNGSLGQEPLFEEVKRRVKWPVTEEELLKKIQEVREERERERLAKLAPQAA